MPTDLDAALEAYLQSQDAPPSLTVVTQAALREYLETRGYITSGHRSLSITPAEHGGGALDVSIKHDDYFAEVSSRCATSA